MPHSMTSYILWVSLLVSALLHGAVAAGDEKSATATFAGGCFWCMEPPFTDIEGVLDVTVGYSGGKETAPRYEDVAAGRTGHREVVQIVFDPTRISYPQLLNIYWRQFDPTDGDGSFGDRGHQYSPAIFYHTEEQRRQAQASRQRLADSAIFSAPLATEISAFKSFYPAEEYHQGYHRKNPLRYRFYRSRSGRDGFIRDTWGDDIMARPFMQDMLHQNNHGGIADQTDSPAQPDSPAQTESPSDPSSQEWRERLAGYSKPSAETLKQKLSTLAFQVTQQDATEPPYRNPYWDHYQPGIYVDVVSGEPLFSSLDQYDSGTGWPSFSQPLEGIELTEKTDVRFFMRRTEVRSPLADSHLGHVFNDGPPPHGLRYCINSAALRFVPLAELESQGYQEFVPLFAPPLAPRLSEQP